MNNKLSHVLLVLFILIFSANSFAFNHTLITDQNREYPTMQGGWGPQQRSIFKDYSGKLWFAHDYGPSVYVNEGVKYYKYNGTNWVYVTYNEFIPPAFGTIQQNTAQILHGTYIKSYGIDISKNWLVECYMDTANTSSKACNTIYISGSPYITPANSNYIGAAVTPSGYRVVWWTEVNTSGAPGKFHYIYNYGSGWNGPVSTTLTDSGGNNYVDLAYVHMTFKNDSHVELVGKLEQKVASGTSCINGSINDYGTHYTCNFAISADFNLGSQLNFRYIPGYDARDIWYNPSDSYYHALTYNADNGEIEYYYKSGDGGVWSTGNSVSGSYARFLADSNNSFYLISSNSSNGLSIRKKDINSHSGSVDWSVITPSYPLFPLGLDDPNGIYVQSRSYQTTSVDFNIGVVGNFDQDDHKIWHFY